MALVILAALPIARGGGAAVSRVASWLYLGLIVLFAILAIGFYEGGYNHLIPNIQYVLGVEHPLREGLYQAPDDLIFQLTGISQFVLALPAAIWVWKLVSSTR